MTGTATAVGAKTIHLAHSPDSDDAFMFYALADGRIDTEGISYVHELQDIETLNLRALRGELDVTAVSIHAYAYLSDTYALLPHGASMGDGYGPKLVAKQPLTRSEIAGRRIAVPGLMTSAYLSLKLFQPDFIPVVVPFDQIEAAVIHDEADAGLLIHESQLTYEDDGFHLIADMGAWWLEQTGLPLPLGGNVIRKDMPRDLQRKVSRHLRASIAYGLDHRRNALDHAMRFARGLDRRKADTFVGMYVNDWTLDYGKRGRAAIRLFLDEGVRSGIITRPVTVEFIDD
jgi:1,4-dihydroxy-6-naphthoate synthase